MVSTGAISFRRAPIASSDRLASSEKTTSDASTGVPSEKVAPSRRVKVYVS
jgi:hypothetical protein